MARSRDRTMEKLGHADTISQEASTREDRKLFVVERRASHITSLSFSFLINKMLKIYQPQPTLILVSIN